MSNKAANVGLVLVNRATGQARLVPASIRVGGWFLVDEERPANFGFYQAWSFQWVVLPLIIGCHV